MAFDAFTNQYNVGGVFFCCWKDPNLFHEFSRSVRNPKPNENDIEVF
jgi:hypothetical protein